MENPFLDMEKRQNIISKPEVERGDAYDPDSDPLKSVVEGMIRSARLKKMRRKLDPKSKIFQKPAEERNYFCTWDVMRFPNGIEDPQGGKYQVGASDTDETGKWLGGGWVRSFDTEYDAERCAYILNKIDTGYGARVYPQEELG